jgi:hypothetical protein
MELAEADKQLIDAAQKGKVADYSAPILGDNDPVKGPEWDDSRTIRAETIYALAVQGNPALPVHVKGIQVRAARIKGCLDFTTVDIKCPLALVGCYIDEVIILNNAFAQTIVLTDTYVFGIKARRLTINGDVYLNGKFNAKDYVYLSRVKINDDLTCGGGTFEKGFSAIYMEVNGDVSLDEKFNLL